MTGHHHRRVGAMTDRNEPNEYGFAGEGTGPRPEPESTAEAERDAAERVAVPADDFTDAADKDRDYALEDEDSDGF
jgi:hypothetical protein